MCLFVKKERIVITTDLLLVIICKIINKLNYNTIKVDFILSQKIQISKFNINLNGKGSGQVKLAAAFAYGG